MSTTVDTSHESMILTIDEAAAYLAIPKATLYTWRTRRAGFGPRAVTSGCHRTVRAAAAGSRSSWSSPTTRGCGFRTRLS